jgi:hypothetical protein
MPFNADGFQEKFANCLWFPAARAHAIQPGIEMGLLLAPGGKEELTLKRAK